MKRSAEASAEPTRDSHTLRADAPPFVPQQPPPPQKMRRTEAPQEQAFGEARRRAHEQAVRDEEEYQAWRLTELADEQPDDEEQVRPSALSLAWCDWGLSAWPY